MPIEQHILITGNPVDGFSHYGPFDSIEEALEYAEDQHGDEECWTAELQVPAGR